MQHKRFREITDNLISEYQKKGFKVKYNLKGEWEPICCVMSNGISEGKDSKEVYIRQETTWDHEMNRYGNDVLAVTESAVGVHGCYEFHWEHSETKIYR